MPSPKEEVWRYVDLDLDLGEFVLPDGPGSPAGEELGTAIGPTLRAAIVDGTPRDEIEERDGWTVQPLDDPEAAEQVRAVLDVAGIPVDLDRFAAAHEAFGGEGVLVHGAAGKALEGPVHVDVEATGDGLAIFPRVLVDAAPGAEGSVVVTYHSRPTDTVLVVPQLVARVGADARLALTVVQGWGGATWSLGQARILLERDASLAFGEVGLGGRLSRWHLGIDLEGAGSEARIVGAYFGDGHQTLDYRYFIRHVGPRTRSDMFLKGAVEDEADSVFTGMIRIEADAQKTEAFQTNRNLILADGASAQSVPNLEILANDVRCGHGSTVGPLDEDQRYYLMSRGLPRERADRLQVRGFFEEALARLPVPGLVPPLRERINAKYVAAQEAGRV